MQKKTVLKLLISIFLVIFIANVSIAQAQAQSTGGGGGSTFYTRLTEFKYVFTNPYFHTSRMEWGPGKIFYGIVNVFSFPVWTVHNTILYSFGLVTGRPWQPEAIQ